MRKQSPQLPFFRKWWPGQLPPAITLPEPCDGDAFSLEYGNAPGGGFSVLLALPFVSPESAPSSP